MSPRGTLPTNNRSAKLQAQPDQALATVIRRLRLERGMTQEELAFEANITVSTMNRAELGKNSPTWTTVLCITAGLGVSLTELAARVESERNHYSALASHSIPLDRIVSMLSE